MTSCDQSDAPKGAFFVWNINPKKVMILNWVFLPSSLVLWAISIYLSKLNIGDYGLLNSLNPLFYAALTLLSLSFVISFFTGMKDKRMYLLMLAFLWVFLFTTPFLIENTARHYTGWARWGMVEYILRNGLLNANDVWYHKWPGFFSFGAIFANVTGIGRDEILIIYPLISSFLFIAFSYIVLKLILGHGLKLWAGLWVVITMNWVNQEFFGPQSLSIVLYLLLFFFMMRLVLNGTRSFGKKEVMAASAVFLFTLSFHILTPFFFILNICFLMLVFGITKLGKHERNILAALFIGAVIMAVALFYDLIAKFLNNVSIDLLLSNIVEFRLLGGNDAHTYIVMVEILTGVALALLIMWGLLIYFRKNGIHMDRTILIQARSNTPLLMFGIILSNAPFLLYHYGGENIMRFYLYSLVPLACILVCCIGHSRKLSVVFLAFLVMAPSLHVFNHYSNERMDYVSSAEIDGADFFFDHITNYSVVINPRGHALLEIRDIERTYILYMPYVEEWGNVSNKTILDIEHYVWICNGDFNTYAHVYNNEETYATIKYNMEHSEVYVKIFDSPDFCLFKGVLNAT